MYFSNEEEHTGIFEVDGFKFRKAVTRDDDRIVVEVMDMQWQTIKLVTVYDLSEVEYMEEVLSSAIYDFIEYQTDEPDKVMAHFTKG